MRLTESKADTSVRACLYAAGSREYEQMNRTDEHQTLCAIFDLRIKVIDAEFYGMDCVQCMEYVLRLCEAWPIRIWMTHYNTPPTHTPPLNSSSSQTPSVLPWHLSFCPVRGDKPQLWLPSSGVHTYIQTHTQSYM